MSRLRRAPAAVLSAIVLLVVAAPSALAYYENYDGYASPPNGYIQNTGGAHTFTFGSGSSDSTNNPMACQLFNNSGTNVVSHDSYYCTVYLGNGAYVYSRVYNQGYYNNLHLYGHADNH